MGKSITNSVLNTTTMNTPDDYQDRELLVGLNESLISARREEKRAKLRVKRLETQVRMVATRLGLHYEEDSAGNAPNFNEDIAELTNEVAFSHQPNSPKAHFLDTSTTSMLPPGWSSAFDEATQKSYFYNATTNVVQWSAPHHQTSSRSNSPTFSQLSHSPDGAASNTSGNETTPTRRRSVYDRLTDTKLYTGASKKRFDNSGAGVKNTTETNLANTKAGGNHHRRHSQFEGSTNTNSEEHFHDISEFLVRDDFQADGNVHRWH